MFERARVKIAAAILPDIPEETDQSKKDQPKKKQYGPTVRKIHRGDKVRRFKYRVMAVAADPMTWAIVGLTAYYAFARHRGYRAGYDVGKKVGLVDGANAMATEYSDVLNAYQVQMTPDLRRDVISGKIWFLKNPHGRA